MSRQEIEYTPLHADFGVAITGLDAAGPQTPDTVEMIKKAIDYYSFVVFPNQSFTDDLQLAFTQSLGEPEESHVTLGEEGRVEYFGTIGNVQADGTAIGNSHPKTVFKTGNNMWHSDSSFRPVPSYVSIMCAYEVPSEGGATLFISQRAAYDRLSKATKEQVDPLVGIHEYSYSRSKVGPGVLKPELAASLPPVKQRMVRRNPRSGAPNLYLGSHCRQVDGWEMPPSRALIDELTEDATASQHIYSHQWQAGDLVIWDNRCLLHRGAGYDADKHRRLMRQTRVRGACNSLAE